MLFRILSFLVGLAVLSSCPETQAATSASKYPAIPATDAYRVPNPAVFYAAKGEENCGPGCSEWIVVEGRLDVGSAQRLRTFLKKQPSSRKIIYFNVSGGLLDESFSIGRLLRGRGMIARVGRTSIKGCEADTSNCAGLIKSGRELEATVLKNPGECSSACLFAILGARFREVEPDAVLRIHAGRVILLNKYPEGSKAQTDAVAASKAIDGKLIKSYLTEMGVPTSFYGEIEKVPYDSPRRLTPEEIVKFGFDTRKGR